MTMSEGTVSENTDCYAWLGTDEYMVELVKAENNRQKRQSSTNGPTMLSWSDESME